MDIKIQGIDGDILKTALKEAKAGRAHILAEMLKVLKAPRAELSKYAPKIIMFTIHPDKIREVIGSGGKVINKIIADTGVKIDIDDDGKVFIAGIDPVMSEKAKSIILSIAEDPKIGTVYTGTVVRILEFGAFVEFAPGRDGMIHISKLANTRVNKVTDVVNIGDTVSVEIIKIDEKGRIDMRLKEKLGATKSPSKS
jgi:polyribonucleotide nucleotidyltransferase